MDRPRSRHTETMVPVPQHLSGCKNLETIKHSGPSPVDISTLQCSDPLPLAFLRGIGLPDSSCLPQP
jgi:hypothetical protein